MPGIADADVSATERQWLLLHVRAVCAPCYRPLQLAVQSAEEAKREAKRQRLAEYLEQQKPPSERRSVRPAAAAHGQSILRTVSGCCRGVSLPTVALYCTAAPEVN